MKIIRQKSNNLVLYFFADHEDIQIKESGLHGPVRALDIKPETHQLLEGVAETSYLKYGGALSYINGTWAVANQPLYEEALDTVIEEAKDKKREALADIVDQKLTAGFTVNGLPVDTTEKGLARLNMGRSNPRTSRKIVTARGKGRAVVTDAEFQAVYDAVETNGQAIMDNWYDLLEAIDAATTTEQIDAIDITQGWP